MRGGEGLPTAVFVFDDADETKICAMVMAIASYRQWHVSMTDLPYKAI
jgi:hypothetical protein